MHRFENKSYKEIAEILQVSTQTVNYRIQQALKQLRVSLKDYLPIIFLLLPKTCFLKGLLNCKVRFQNHSPASRNCSASLSISSGLAAFLNCNSPFLLIIAQ